MDSWDRIVVCAPKGTHKVEFHVSNGNLYSFFHYYLTLRNQERLLAIGKAMQEYYDSGGQLDPFEWFQVQLAKAGLKFEATEVGHTSRLITVEHDSWEMVLGNYFIKQKYQD